MKSYSCDMGVNAYRPKNPENLILIYKMYKVICYCRITFKTTATAK